MSVKITQEDWEKFKKQYMFEFMRNADYRFGQAFLNYFPELQTYLKSTSKGEGIEIRLWEATTQNEAMAVIGQLILFGDIER